MNPFSIKLSTNTGIEDHLNRLQRVVFMIVAAQAVTEIFEGSEILRLHDHKGGLEVYWKDTPSDIQKQFMAVLWEMIGELSMNVLHGHPEITRDEAFELRYAEDYYKL